MSKKTVRVLLGLFLGLLTLSVAALIVSTIVFGVGMVDAYPMFSGLPHYGDVALNVMIMASFSATTSIVALVWIVHEARQQGHMINPGSKPTTEINT